MQRYVHPEIGEEIRAIGGGYTTVKEQLRPMDDRQVLYAVIVGHADTSCCGAGGCAYANVAGYVVELQTQRAPDGSPVSLVEPIRDEAARERITRSIRAAEKIEEVRFWSADGSP